jgi:hypothetical protein
VGDGLGQAPSRTPPGPSCPAKAGHPVRPAFLRIGFTAYFVLFPVNGTGLRRAPCLNPLALLCAASLALLGTRILAQIMLVGWHAPHSLRHYRSDETTSKTEVALISNANR